MTDFHSPSNPCHACSRTHYIFLFYSSLHSFTATFRLQKYHELFRWVVLPIFLTNITRFNPRKNLWSYFEHANFSFHPSNIFLSVLYSKFLCLFVGLPPYPRTSELESRQSLSNYPHNQIRPVETRYPAIADLPYEMLRERSSPVTWPGAATSSKCLPPCLWACQE